MEEPKFNLVKIIPSINADLIEYEIISGLVFSDLKPSLYIGVDELVNFFLFKLFQQN